MVIDSTSHPDEFLRTRLTWFHDRSSGMVQATIHVNHSRPVVVVTGMQPESSDMFPSFSSLPAGADRPQRESTPADMSALSTAMTPNRRQVLRAAGLGVGALTLVACSNSTTGAASTPSPPSAAGSTAPAPSSSSAAASTSPGAASGGVSLVALASVPVGQAVSATLDGKPIIVAQPAAGQAVAFSAICTHMGCTVAPNGAELDCPCHGSRYNALTGQVIQGPAPQALPKIAVSVQNGEVVTG
jgi:Rieske Fe-S protein